MAPRIIVNQSSVKVDPPSPAGAPRAMTKLLRERSIRRPAFSGCWISANIPADHKVIEEYEVLGARVTIATGPLGGEVLYHIAPWEYDLPADRIHALSEIIADVPFLPPPSLAASGEELRLHVKEVATRKLRAKASSGDIDLGRSVDQQEAAIYRLSEIVARYTVGLGLIEVLLSDDRIEDIYIDAPSWKKPVHVTMSGLAGNNHISRCLTNVTVSEEEVAKLASRLRHTSGRPFSQAFPVMETDVEGHDSRATVIGPPLSPDGTAVALRRHSRNPWTLLKLVQNGTLGVETAGLLSFLIDGRCSILICGARGAGKSSLLSALMFEFPVDQRILTIEDTLELPGRHMQRLGYKVQSLFVEPRLDVSTENMAEQALRVSLRLGESAIVLGEVRGREAHTLYESMRTGRAGSSVLGTIHGESASSVYERVVHDMGIPREAFLATDIVLTMGLHRPGGSSLSTRRLVEVAECRKEGDSVGFRQLLERDPAIEAPSIATVARSAVVSRIASSWGMDADEAEENILARAAMRSMLLKAATCDPEYLSASWVVRCNEFLRGRIDAGDRDYGRIVDDFRAYVQGRCGHEL